MSTLLVTVDAVRRDHLSQYGYHRNTLPVVDGLLDDGAVQFDDVVANGTFTGISLPSILTSRYLGDDYVRDGPTVATALPDDVTTGAIHSNTFFASKFDGIAGFDVYEDFYGESEHAGEVSTANRLSRTVFDTVRPWLKRTGAFEFARRVQEAVLPASLIHEVAIFESAAVTTDRALAFLDAVDGEFFLWVHYMDPHRPYAINADPPAYAPAMDRGAIIDLMAEAGVNPERIDTDQRELLVDLYDSAIRYTSDHVGRLFDGLRSRGDWDDATVVLTADHGEEFGEHGRYFHRNRPYDESIRVPLVVKSPLATAVGDEVTGARELLDLAPTACAAHGVDPPGTFLGENLFAGRPRRQFTTGSFRDDGRVVSARFDGWKYIAVEGGDDELYDLGADPGETRNVRDAHPDRAAAYREAIPDHLFTGDSAGVPDADDVSDDVEARLEKLGYLE